MKRYTLTLTETEFVLDKPHYYKELTIHRDLQEDKPELINESIKEMAEHILEDYVDIRETLNVYTILQNTSIDCLKQENENLKLQLAEKEKENSVLKAVIDKNKTGQFGAVHICNAISEFYEPLVKDMIIAELEKVKDFIIKNNEPTPKMTKITRFINQQIRTLKGEK